MSKTIISTENAPAAIGPYSQAVRTDRTIYVSGQLPLDPATKQMAEGAAAQTTRSMQNIQAILETAGCTMENIVRCGIFVTDLDDFAAINEAYAAFFTGNFPARATVQVAALPLGAKVEIDAIAVDEE